MRRPPTQCVDGHDLFVFCPFGSLLRRRGVVGIGCRGLTGCYNRFLFECFLRTKPGRSFQQLRGSAGYRGQSVVKPGIGL